MRDALATLVALVSSTLVVTAAPAAFGGAAELTLDRRSVERLLEATVPQSVEAPLPGWGPVTLELGRPRETNFADGGVETTLPVRIATAGIALDVALRYLPELEPRYGTPLLRPASARVAGLDLDLTALLPPVVLPRGGDWTIPLDTRTGDPGLRVRYFVQGLAVEDERLRVDLGLTIGPPHPVRAENRR